MPAITFTHHPPLPTLRIAVSAVLWWQALWCWWCAIGVHTHPTPTATTLGVTLATVLYTYLAARWTHSWLTAPIQPTAIEEDQQHAHSQHT